tara:strand:- start:347 stop:628 length:282 start_codon:yes stop_codon:yes gene_type:complete
MLLKDGDYDDFDLLEYIVVHLNHIEEDSKIRNYSSDEKLDYVLAKIQLLMAPSDYARQEKFLIIVIRGLVKLGNGEYRVKTNPHKKTNCCCIC